VRVVLDTNVLISGIFFGGHPRAVLEAWVAERYELVISPSIVDEYVQTCDRLGASHPSLEYQPILAAIIGHSTLVPDTPGFEPITADPDDDKFMLCAEGSGATVVSGDQHLLDADGWHDTPVLKPRDFLDSLPEDTPSPE
jgi:putative PIN family toxin of toxin-antitoxin system